MRYTTLVLLCLCGLFLFTTADQVFSPVPLVLFGTGTTYSAQQHLETIHSSDVQSILNDAVSAKSEVVLIFIEPRLTTEQLWETSSFSHLKELIKGESTVYPYVSAESGVASSIEKVAASLPKGANIFLSKEAGSPFLKDLSVQTFNRNALMARLKKNSEIYTNGVTDLVIVFFDSVTDTIFAGHEVDAALASDDAYIDSIVKIVDAKTNGKFIATFTADKPFVSTVSRTPFEAPRYKFEIRSTPSNTTIYTSYWPIVLLEVYIAAAVLLFIAFLGILCTCNLQSPARFETQKAAKKE